MIRTNDIAYDLSRPPVILANRDGVFTCCVCNRPGFGPPNSEVHPGRCRRTHTADLAAKRKEKARSRMAAAIARATSDTPS